MMGMAGFMSRGFVMSIEALATLLMALGAFALIYSGTGADAGNMNGLVNEMQAHDVAWVAGYGAEDAELEWLADGLDACVKIDNEEHGGACGGSAEEAYAAGFVSVSNGEYSRSLAVLEKH